MANKWLKRAGVATLLGATAIGLSLHFGGASAVGRIGKADAEQAIAADTAPVARELSPVEVTTVEPRAMTERLRVSGELQPVNRAVIKAKVSGTVTEVNARQGQAVRSGDVLVRFETDDLESALVQHASNLDAARAQLVLAEQTLDKTKELAGRGFATTAALEKAQSDVAGARASVQGLDAQTETARTALGNAELVAPFDGIIAGRSIEPGETANASTQLLTLVDTSVLEAEVLASTRDITRLAVGQRVDLRVDGVDDLSVVGTVDRIAPTANEGTRFVPVHIRLDNTDGRLWGGMFATGDILVREQTDVLAIPATALRSDDAGDYVLKLADGVLVRQSIVAGSRWEGGRLIEIAEGLTAGDIVLSATLPELTADMPVVLSSAD